MIKKNTLIVTIALITSACANQAGLPSYEQSVTAAADKISADNQQGYFACKFERHETECRQKIWETHPKPKLSRGLTRETLPDFLSAVELRGAGHLLDANGYACGKPQDISGMFWKRGYDVTCANGQHYIVDSDKQQWRIEKASNAQ